MRKVHVISATSIAIGLFGAFFLLTTLSVAQSPPAAPPPFNPTFGDLMNLIVQPRHVKLGLAGRDGNWPLAEYEIKELRAALGNVARSRPRFRDKLVSDMIEAVMGAPFRSIDEAIRDRNPKKFADAYVGVTEGCNSCHAALNHPFVVIKLPDQSSFPNQDFRLPK